MYRFEVSSAGLVRETSVESMVGKLKERFPNIDELALESHLMLELTHSVLADMRATYWGQFGLTGRRFTVLRLLYLANENQMSMGEVATNLNIGTNNTTQLIDGMVRDDLVQRISRADDKRVIFAKLTDKGRELFADVFPKNANRIKEAWLPLSEQEKQVMLHLLARLRMHLVATDASGIMAMAQPAAGRDTQEPERAEQHVTTLSQPE